MGKTFMLQKSVLMLYVIIFRFPCLISDSLYQIVKHSKEFICNWCFWWNYIFVHKL